MESRHCAPPNYLIKNDKFSLKRTQNGRPSLGKAKRRGDFFKKSVFGECKMHSLADTRRGLQFVSVNARSPIGMTRKRIIDVILALSGIIVLAPLLLICFVLTIATSRGPALFRHRRVGFHGRHFECLK